MEQVIHKCFLKSWVDRVDWPPAGSFCLVVVVDSVADRGPGVGEFILAAVKAGACEAYCWGKDANRAADHATFAISFEETTRGKITGLCEGFVTLPFEGSAEEVAGLILHSYLPDALECCPQPVLLICGMRNCVSLELFLEAVFRIRSDL